MKIFKMPDFLPSKFESWNDFYRDIVKLASLTGMELNEDSEINFTDHIDYKEREKIIQAFGEDVRILYNFPLSIIKSRAFDELDAKLPKYIMIRKIESQCHYRDDDTEATFHSLRSFTFHKR